VHVQGLRRDEARNEKGPIFGTLPLRYCLMPIAICQLQFHKNVPATKQPYITIYHMPTPIVSLRFTFSHHFIIYIMYSSSGEQPS
jgi:hypothetical protein